MDFLNKFYEQLRDIFASMTPGARITTGALLAVVVVSVGFLFKQSTAGPGEMLYGGEPLTRQEIIDIQGALSQAGLSDFETVGNMIRVPSGSKHLYLAAIADAGAVPKSTQSFMDEALSGLSPLSSSDVQKAQFKSALKKELSHIISQISWVDSANVVFDEKVQRGPRPTTIATASVSVMPKRGEGIDAARRRNLQTLVAHSFASMKPDQVAVINLNGDDGIAGGSVSPEDFDTPYFKEKRRFEEAIRQNVVAHLSYIPGVRVQIKAELDEKLSTHTTRTSPDGTPVTLREEETTEETKSQNSDGGNRPGGFAQGPSRGARNEEVAARTNSSETKSSSLTSQNTVGQITEIVEESGLVPKEMSASIEVPMDYVIGVWRMKKLASEGKTPELVNYEEVKLVEGEVADKIKTAVEPLMTELSAGKDDYQQVKVITYDTLPGPPVEEPTAADKAMFWATQHGSSLAMLGMAVFSLVMLRSMVKSSAGAGPTGGPSLQLDTPEVKSGSGGAADDDEESNARKLKLRKPDTVKDDLADIVREDPDAAAAILSNWISNAS